MRGEGYGGASGGDDDWDGYGYGWLLWCARHLGGKSSGFFKVIFIQKIIISYPESLFQVAISYLTLLLVEGDFY